jgi:hypothetical protein
LEELERNSPAVQSIDMLLASATSAGDVEELLRVREYAVGQNLQALVGIAAIDARTRAEDCEQRRRDRNDRFAMWMRLVIFLIGVALLVIGIAFPQVSGLEFLAAFFLIGGIVHQLNPEWVKLFMERLPTLTGSGTRNDDVGA